MSSSVCNSYATTYRYFVLQTRTFISVEKQTLHSRFHSKKIAIYRCVYTPLCGGQPVRKIRRLPNISPGKEKVNILSTKDAVPRSQSRYVTFEQDSQLTLSSTARRYTHIYVVCTFHRPSPESDVCQGDFSRAPSDTYRSACKVG